MSSEKLYRYRNRITGYMSTRTFTAAQVARMRINPAYKGLVFIEIHPVTTPPTLAVTKKGKDAGQSNTANAGTSSTANGADPGSDNDGNSNG